MTHDEMLALFDRLDYDGPVDVFVSESEYEGLKLRLRGLWQRPESWGRRDYLLLLAFFRGYTFYKEISENNNAFWQSFCKELNLPQVTPQNAQYEAIWNALGHDPRTKDFRIVEGGRRQFVKSIDAIWGITSFKAHEVVKAFIKYYRERPQDSAQMQDLLPFDEATPQGQLANYYRVFKSMVRVVDHVLEHDLAVDEPERLERRLGLDGVDLGKPNVLKYFTNKSANALATIFAQLRFQRTPAQFKTYLRKTSPLLPFRTPHGETVSAQSLAKYQEMPYGEYWDVSNDEAHHIVPSPRISLKSLKHLPKNEFYEAAGVDVYLSDTPFTVRQSDSTRKSKRVYFGRSKAYIWAEKVASGEPLYVDGQAHPKALGHSLTLKTKFRYHQAPLVTLDVSFKSFSLDERVDVLHIGERAFPILGNSSFELEISSSTVPVRFGSEVLETWRADGQVFTQQGTDITDRAVHTHDKDFWVLGTKPTIKGVGDMQQVSHEPEIWQVTWTSQESLQIGQTVLNRPNSEDALVITKADKTRPHRDIEVVYDDDCHIEGEALTFELPTNVSDGASLVVDGREFIADSSVVVSDLSQGSYQPELRTSEYSLLLPEIRVLPRVIWELPDESKLVEGRTYAATLRLDDGRLKKFRFKPRLDNLGASLPSHHVVELDHDITISFSLKCKAYAARLVNREDKTVLKKLMPGQIKGAEIGVIDPYQNERKLRLRLSSDPEKIYNGISELNNLIPAAKDQLFVEMCLNESSSDWILLHRVLIHSTPSIKELSVSTGWVQCQIENCSDVSLRIEETDKKGLVRVSNTHALPSSKHLSLPLQHPHKFAEVDVRIYFAFVSSGEEKLVKEFSVTPYAGHDVQLERGLAWSASSRRTRK